MDKQKRINWLKGRISSMEQCRDEIPFGLSEDESMELSAYRDSLASLTAVPFGWEIAGNIFPTLEEALKPGYIGTPEPIYDEPPVTGIKIPDTEIFNNLAGEMMQKSMDSKGIAAKAYSEAAHKIALTSKEFRDEIKRLNGLGE